MMPGDERLHALSYCWRPGHRERGDRHATSKQEKQFRQALRLDRAPDKGVGRRERRVGMDHGLALRIVLKDAQVQIQFRSCAAVAGEVPTAQADLHQVICPEIGLQKTGGGDEDPVGAEPDGEVAVGPGDQARLPEPACAPDQRLCGGGPVRPTVAGQSARSKTIRPSTSVRSQRPATAVPLNGELRLLEKEVVTS